MKRILSMVLAVAMILGTLGMLSGCGNEEKAEGTLSVYGGGNPSDVFENADRKEDAYKAIWQGYTDKKLEWPEGEIEFMMNSGDYPDVIIWGGSLQSQHVAKYASEGVFIALDEYINETDTPNIWRMFHERPLTKAVVTSPDGHIYELPKLKENKAESIENALWINKAWLDKLGLEMPKTIDELYEVLKAFKTQDPNGNGQADEIPLVLDDDSAYGFSETLLSAWGISTKFGRFDSWMNIVDGEVRFAPVLDEWKELYKFYRKLYAEGLMDIEAFTQTEAQFKSKLGADTPVAGLTFYDITTPAFGNNADQYTTLTPISADGKIKPVYRIHPGYMATKGGAFVTDACDDPRAALMFLDHFYDVEQSIMNIYGPVGEVKDDCTFTIKDGMYTWNEPEAGKTVFSLAERNTIYNGASGVPCYIPSDAIGTLLEKADFMASYDAIYEQYEPYIDNEVWPRPNYPAEDAARLNELLIDITNYVNQSKADFVTGKRDIDAEWDSYIDNLKKLGADELLAINKNAYEIFKKAADSVK